jgi:hypothetical protein
VTSFKAINPIINEPIKIKTCIAPNQKNNFLKVVSIKKTIKGKWVRFVISSELCKSHNMASSSFS